MRISIITPSLNQGEFIEDTIRSVMNQNHDDIEHIVVDGGSTDNTISILKKYPHLKWISEKDSGQSNAINKGFRMITGDIVAWLNADDYYEENVFDTVARYFESQADCMVLYGDIIYVDRNKKFLFSIIGDVINHLELIKCPDIVRQPSFFWRHKVMKEVGGVDESLNLVMDYDFFLRISKIYKFHYLARNLSYYRLYDENKSLSLAKGQMHEIYKVYKKNNVVMHYSVYKYLFFKYLHSFGIKKKIKNMFTSVIKK